MSIRDQIKAIKDCLAKLGYNSFRVEHVRTNPNDRTLKTFKVQYSFGKMSKSWCNGIYLLVNNRGIISLSTIGAEWQRIMLFEIEALDKALGGK